MKTAWTPKARADYSEIYSRIEDDDPNAALYMDELFEKRTADLVVHPNYILIYDIAGDTIRTLRLLHAAQKWPSQKH